MASRVPTEQIPVLLLIFWAAMLVLSIFAFIRSLYDRIVPAMLVIAFSGLLFQVALMFRKDR